MNNKKYNRELTMIFIDELKEINNNSIYNIQLDPETIEDDIKNALDYEDKGKPWSSPMTVIPDYIDFTAISNALEGKDYREINNDAEPDFKTAIEDAIFYYFCFTNCDFLIRNLHDCLDDDETFKNRLQEITFDWLLNDFDIDGNGLWLEPLAYELTVFCFGCFEFDLFVDSAKSLFTELGEEILDRYI